MRHPRLGRQRAEAEKSRLLAMGEGTRVGMCEEETWLTLTDPDLGQAAAGGTTPTMYLRLQHSHHTQVADPF